MTVEELIKIDAKKVRNSSDLMAFYISAFKSKFGKAPNCASCTFKNDFQKLVKAIKNNEEPIKLTTMENKEITFKLAKREGKIISFVKNGRTIRRYDNKLTEEFAIDYLTFGTKEEILERRKRFKVLPAEIIALDNKALEKKEAKQKKASETKKDEKEVKEPKPKKATSKK